MAASRELVYGPHAVMAALRRDPSRLLEIRLAEGAGKQGRLRQIADEAHNIGIAVYTCPRKALDVLVTAGEHQGVIAWRKPGRSFSEYDLEALLAAATPAPLLLILDGVQDPHNLGACLRTADAAGVTAVIAPRDRAAGLTPTVRKVASGAAESTPFIQVTNLARCLRELKDRGIWLVGADGEAEMDLFAAELTGPLGLVMGAEGQGLRRLTREHCDFLVRIPMLGTVESLNVSVATGICLFEAVRRRRLQR
ncbi:MAG: 23S rRNA (guanosine(2251)-2'-O)-methyltransferase RlmB [Gammaproteobacteria bacterium]|jgi:23S rRNA (guanosine2251-2'-O)-methyltransferase